MGIEEKVSKQIEQYQELAKEHKGIDAAALMISALEQAHREEVDQKKIRRAYLVSVVAPPLGLLYAAYYAFGDKPDGKRIAVNCVIFTAITLLVAWVTAQLLFSGMGGPDAASQIQNVNIDEVRTLLAP